MTKKTRTSRPIHFLISMPYILRGATQLMSIDQSVFVAKGAMILGDVSIGEGSSVWYNVVVRGDINTISIGKNTNIQDLSCIHVADDCPVVIGDHCVIGHQATIHGAQLGNRVLVGMGALLLNGVTIGDDCIIAAGTLIPEKTIISAGSVVMGFPCKITRSVTDAEKQETFHLAQKYQQIAQAELARQQVGT